MRIEELKPIIDEILKYYFNRNTRIIYDSKTQSNMVAQNKGLINACCAVIEFCDDRDAIVGYTKSKIDELNNGEAQKVMIEE